MMRKRARLPHGKMCEFETKGYEIHDQHYMTDLRQLGPIVKEDNSEGQDVVILMTGNREGSGKSLLMQIIARIVALTCDFIFIWREDTIYYDWREFLAKYRAKSRKWPRWDFKILDEVWEVLFSRESAKGPQKRVARALGTERMKHHNLGLCGPDIGWFDKVLRRHKGHIWLHIAWRRKGWVQVRIMVKCRTQIYPTDFIQWDCLGHINYQVRGRGATAPVKFVKDYDQAKDEAKGAWEKTEEWKERKPKGKRRRRKRKERLSHLSPR